MGKVELGDRVKDKVTGFEGIVVGITSWLNGCARVGIQGNGRTEQGLPQDAWWVDDFQVEVLKKSAIETGSTETGGPRPTANRNADPRR